MSRQWLLVIGVHLISSGGSRQMGHAPTQRQWHSAQSAFCPLTSRYPIRESSPTTLTMWGMKGLTRGSGRIKTLILATNADYALNQHLLTLSNYVISLIMGSLPICKITVLHWIKHNLTVSNVLKNPRHTQLLEKYSQIQTAELSSVRGKFCLSPYQHCNYREHDSLQS